MPLSFQSNALVGRVAELGSLGRFTRMKIFDWLDGIEVTVAAIVAAILLILGPLFITYRFALAHRQGAALLTGALWICCVAACVRDFRRQRLSWVSGGILALWLVTALALGFIAT